MPTENNSDLFYRCDFRLFSMFGITLHPHEAYDYIDAINIKKTGAIDFPEFKIFCMHSDLFGKLKNHFDVLISREFDGSDDDEYYYLHQQCDSPLQ